MKYPAILLADPSANLRRRILLDLFHRPLDDGELEELDGERETDPLFAELAAAQDSNGSWRSGTQGPVFATSMALLRLGMLGFRSDHPVPQRGASFLFSRQRSDGSWKGTSSADEDEERDEGYAVIPFHTALPLQALASSGFSEDTRAEKGFEFLLNQCLPDGAWPTGITKSGVFGRVAGYRRLPHSGWGCRTNTTAALLCLAGHPRFRNGVQAYRALDLLLGRETRDAHTLGFETARIIGAEPAQGCFTFHARFDPALILFLCAEIGAPLSDPRVADTAAFVKSLAGFFGLWDYGRKPQLSRWISFDILHSLSRLVENNDRWQPTAPRTPFTPYPKRQKRF